MPTPTLPQIIADMLAYQADQFDEKPSLFYVDVTRGGMAPRTHGPYDTDEEARARRDGFLLYMEGREDVQATVRSETGDLSVSGADLVDAFTVWRRQLFEAFPDLQEWHRKMDTADTVVAADAVAADFLRAVGFTLFADAWREQVGAESTDGE